jgi:hypothetical protein
MLHNEVWVFVEAPRRFLDAFDVRAVMISRLASFLSYVAVIFNGKANEVGNEVCDLVGYYGAECGESVSTFRNNKSVLPSRIKKSNFSLDFLTLSDGSDRLSWNINPELSLYAPQYPRRSQIASTSRRKPETLAYPGILFGGGGGSTN